MVANPNHLRFVRVPQGYDEFWPRDWGPHPVFTERGKLIMGCAQYLNSTPNSGVEADATLLNPYCDHFDEQMEKHGVESENTAGGEALDGTVLTPNDNNAAPAIATQLGFEHFKMPITLTGGNIMSDGRGSMISCAILTNENRFNGINDEDFFRYAAEELGADNYSILSNYEDLGIQHVDCLLKMVDEETLIIARPPQDHPLYARYERIVEEEIARLRTCYGRPYRIFRVDTARFQEDELTAYANSYILNKKVYVPQYGIPQDAIALEQWQDAMPGYEIKGFLYNYDSCDEEEYIGLYEGHTGWAPFDVIHCRTRSVWDKDMLYMSMKRINETTVEESTYPVYVQIVDYSGQGLEEGTQKLYWRLKGNCDWNEIPLLETPSKEYFLAEIPAVAAGNFVEYYVAAASKSGRKETMPRVAPKGVYTFQVVKS